MKYKIIRISDGYDMDLHCDYLWVIAVTDDGKYFKGTGYCDVGFFDDPIAKQKWVEIVAQSAYEDLFMENDLLEREE
jgi:hypothetical protein